ncbi:hypothetical protein [Spirosoma endophyticum]|uniref:KOW motif-containing protein n=1 Tax=Spirosoma endophyticum TaxID=662367 RepID=A0A1I2I0Z5_9BACT|nr:hypothetical protein [Spirosoma endophyticum]SFF35313.1 hypothetical protein SAMN05216167_15216 [Spirosoma endophyticum]
MKLEINPGDRVEVIRVSKGSFYRGRYEATVIGQTNGRRIKVRDDQGKDHSVYFKNVKKLP